MTSGADMLAAARAEALFTSSLSIHSHPASTEVNTAIRQAVRACGGTRGCACVVATEYGDHPETAVPRMRWARSMVDDLFPVRRGELRAEAVR